MMISKNQSLKEKARDLRKARILSEVLLWKRIKNKQIKGRKFRKQVPIGNYVVDFYCPVLNLVIEIDGCSHYEKEEYDYLREKYLRNLGIKILKFVDSQVKRNMEGVIHEIEEFIDKEC